MNKKPESIKQQMIEILGEEGFSRAFADINQPSCLPNEAYWSRQWLKLEYEQLFKKSWVFVATGGEISQPGCIKPLDIVGTPIMVVRGKDNQVRAFHNVCRHRGTKLVEFPCKVPSITCPYHAWNYRLDGKLNARPHFHCADQLDRLDTKNFPEPNLYRIRCEHWNDCYFINISGNTIPLLDWLQPMLAKMPHHDLSNIQWIGKQECNIKSNWKLILENYMDGYHVFTAHPRLLTHAPMSIRWAGEWNQHVFYNDYVVPELTPGRGDSLPQFPNLSSIEQRRGFWIACLPNFAVEVFADQFVLLISYPISPSETFEELHFFVVNQSAAADPNYEKARKELMDMWSNLNNEDASLLEQLQRGRRSEAFDGARLSPHWDNAVHQLSRILVDTLLSN